MRRLEMKTIDDLLFAAALRGQLVHNLEDDGPCRQLLPLFNEKHSAHQTDQRSPLDDLDLSGKIQFLTRMM